MFTPGQVSDMLEVPGSTLRRYVKQFSAQLSPGARRRRGRRFTEVDVAMLARARELLAQGRKPKEVAELLQVVDQEQETPAETALALVPSISKALTDLRDAAGSIKADVDILTDQQALTDQRVSQLVAELEAWRSRPWWRRLLGLPPDLTRDE